MGRRVAVGTLLVLLVLLAGVCGGLVALPNASGADTKVGPALGNAGVAWNPDDPRPEPERLKALLEFATETYGGTEAFGVPTSLVMGNAVTRAIWDYDQVLERKIGLVGWPENREAPVYGIAASRGRAGTRSYTSNCVMCHIAEIDGVVYFGAGSKIQDEKVLVDMALKAASPVGRVLLGLDPRESERLARVRQTLESHRHEKTDPLTRGRSTAFVRSHVELYRLANRGSPPPAEAVGRGDAKVPPLWHYAAKAPFGRWYLDGSFRGAHPIMASSMELAKGRTMEEVERTAIPKIVEQFESVIAHLRAPAYPYRVDRALAERGGQLFYSEAIGCHRCHGIYDERGGVRWTGVHTHMGTDPARLQLISPGFREAFRQSPLGDRWKLIRSHGYAATPLTGVWANFPYLHNGSVPTLYHLLGPVSERPRIFYVPAATRFDRIRVGQRLLPDGLDPGLPEAELVRRFGEDRDWFTTDRPGSGSMGHDVWDRIKTDENRKALIEYLKTL
jgi:hypothetical protein